MTNTHSIISTHVKNCNIEHYLIDEGFLAYINNLYFDEVIIDLLSYCTMEDLLGIRKPSYGSMRSFIVLTGAAQKLVFLIMVLDQILRSFLLHYGAALAVVLFLVTTITSLCIVLIEKGQITFTVAPLISNQTLLDLLVIDGADNGTLY